MEAAVNVAFQLNELDVNSQWCVASRRETVCSVGEVIGRSDRVANANSPMGGTRLGWLPTQHTLQATDSTGSSPSTRGSQNGDVTIAPIVKI